MSPGGSRRTTRRAVAAACLALGLLGVAAAVSSAWLAPSSLAGASPLTQPLPLGSVRTADVPLPDPVVPTDGRLRGPDFSATVTEVTWPASVRVHELPTVAPAGYRLLAFELRLTEPGATAWSTGATAATAAVDIQGDELAVPMTEITSGITGQSAGEVPATGTGAFVVAVPAHQHDVVLSVTQDGFTQRFSLWTLHRLAPDPTVLYRAPTGSVVTSTQRGSAKLTVTNPSTGFVTVATLSLSAATLRYFAPDGSGASPSQPTQAFLSVTVRATYTTAAHTLTDYLAGSPVPGSQLTFTPSGGAPVTATTAVHQSDHHQGPDDGFFDAYYWFTVPATTTAGTLSIEGGPVTGSQYTTYYPTGTTQLTFSGAQIPVSFPDLPAAPAAQRTPPWVGAPLPTTGSEATGPTTGGGTVQGPTTGGFPVWLAVVLVALLAAGTVAAERVVRRRRVAATAGATGGAVVDAAAAAMVAPAPGTVTGATKTGRQAPPATGAPVPGTEPAVAPPAPPTGAAAPSDAAAPEPAGSPALGGPGDLVVRVLGPVEVTGWDPPAERRGVIEELCCFLALHQERPRTTAELLAALWPVDGERGEASPKTLHNYLSRLRQAVGADHLPDAVTTGGYVLQATVSDWERFWTLARRADVTEGTAADRLRDEALALVRGAPFAGAPIDQYGWALSSGLATAMTVAVVDVAARRSAALLAAGDPLGAEAAARSGLRGAPEDEGLWQAGDRAAQASGDPARATRLRRDMAAALGAERARVLWQAAGG